MITIPSRKPPSPNCDECIRTLPSDYPKAQTAHLVDCYLQIQADRDLIGPKRSDEVIKNKPWYTSIYKTILRDEDKIRGVVQEHSLEIK